MASVGDFQLAAAAAGFTLGFGFLTVWEAIKQTRANKSPLRSVYIYMVWGEILSNLAIGIVGWLFLNGTLGPTVPVLFFILVFWVFEIQLLMQIIINRIAIIAANKKLVKQLKIGTAIVITMINIAVFCIWIPSHTNPPVSKTYVNINKYWDRTSKVLICLVDGGLNYYFLRTVRVRLVHHYGLIKYQPLVSFNAKLMVLSVAMDIMLIGLMSLPNQVVYVQFHPVTYMVKLNIEMSMASLIARLAKGESNNDMHFGGPDTQSHTRSGNHDRKLTIDLDRHNDQHRQGHMRRHSDEYPNKGSMELKTYEVDPNGHNNPVKTLVSKVGSIGSKRGSKEGRDIVRRTDLHIVVERDDRSDERPLHYGVDSTKSSTSAMEAYGSSV